MQHVVITGVSSGIGYVTAQYLIKKGFHIFGSVRKEEDAQKLEKEFGQAFTPMLFDVTEEKAVKAAAQLVRGKLNGKRLSGLVNNAGITVPGPLLLISPDDFRRQLEVNLTGQLIVIQAFAPLLGTDPSLAGEPGRIINLGSILGTIAIPFIGPYVTSKSGMEGFSDTLRRELKLYDIPVILVRPGSYETLIWKKGAKTDTSVWEKSAYAASIAKFKQIVIKRMAEMPAPGPVAEIIFHALTTRHPKARYTPVPHRFSEWIIPTSLPTCLFDKLIAWQLGLSKSSSG